VLAGQTVQFPFVVVQVPVDPAAHTQPDCAVAPLVVDAVAQAEQLSVPTAALKVLAGHDAQPVFAAVHVPLNPAIHSQPVCPRLGVDPVAHTVQLPVPTAALKVLAGHGAHPVFSAVHVPLNPAMHRQPVCSEFGVDPMEHTEQGPEPAEAL
jgi:hypothetical protein